MPASPLTLTSAVCSCGRRCGRTAREQARPESRRSPGPAQAARPPPAAQAAARPLRAREGARVPLHSPVTAGAPPRRLPRGSQSRSRNRTLPSAPREAVLPPRSSPGALGAGALLTPTTLSPFLPGRREPLATHLPQPLRASARPYRDPGRARRGGGAARSQWPGAGGERASSQAAAAGSQPAEAEPARAYRAGPGRAREAAGAPRAAPCDSAGAQLGRVERGGGGGTRQLAGRGQPASWRSFSRLLTGAYFFSPSSLRGVWHFSKRDARSLEVPE